MGSNSAIVITPADKKYKGKNWENKMNETIALTKAIGLNVIYQNIVPIFKTNPATLIGSGKVDEIKNKTKNKDINVIVVDHTLSPVQQRNLEKKWNNKVIDRTGLILEIFALRAQTKEGKLQVEWAQLMYQKGRLVRSWTHLERQRGAVGTVGGPGETQIEADRRQIDKKIKKIKQHIEKIKKNRSLHRQNRQKTPYRIVALVGYTNAGKSTLFNALTGENVPAKDMLFATLDAKMGKIKLNENWILVCDTVGFISDLPTHLVAAFRATLEEVIESDLIVHVRDISDQNTNEQCKNVYEILKQIGIEKDDERIIEVWNKIDQTEYPHNNTSQMQGYNSNRKTPIPICAINGKGISELKEHIRAELT